MSGGRIAEAAARLREASESGVPCEPVRDLLPGATVNDAYEVQRQNLDLALQAGGRIVGWKIGLTSEAVQQQLGVDQPDFGVLLAETAELDGLEVGAGLLQPRVEAEVGFVLEADLPAAQVTSADVLAATAFVVPAIEIVDSRIRGWDISIVDTIADNASAGAFVLGGRPTPLHDVDLGAIEMTLRAGDQVVSKGTGAACLAHPVNAVVWLANTLSAVGRSLRAGDLILSGALGPMVPVEPGTTYQAEISELGRVRAVFGPAPSEEERR